MNRIEILLIIILSVVIFLVVLFVIAMNKIKNILKKLDLNNSKGDNKYGSK